MKQRIMLRGRSVEYELQRKTVKNINLRVKPDGSVWVSAHRAVPQAVIEAFMRQKASFILRAIDRYAGAAGSFSGELDCGSGDLFRVLGRDLRLKVEAGPRNRVLEEGDFLLLQVRDPDDRAMRRRTLEIFQRQKCRETVEEICGRVYPRFGAYGVARPELRFRRMSSRWGSCQPQRGVLTFNALLAAAPADCIEYVVIHEFTHFLCPNHSGEFYALLAGFLPDWKERRKRLEEVFAAPKNLR